ncbi:hypothetical protein T265_06636 [Opisthorchis viverrini]|uniref:Glycolipid transfer protein domain-containing protein n=1 Tax=Opisthorchis viverrini TaxID=6198 RepID=A0A074ZJV9_OPIVI|nr:hypothetical protein T265_06636 [Opisthorchis viverrini]KER26062.1 hypothetical protein T265_06636 [Opisthorchis viverrini]
MHGEKGPENIMRIDAKKDLRIWVSSNLSFSLHHEKSAQKAFAILRMIRCTFSRITCMQFQILYGAYVRPLLEYANQVVYSGLTKDVTLIERVQRASTRMVAGLKSVEYETRLAMLDLFPLEYRRLRGDLILTHALFEQSLANRTISQLKVPGFPHTANESNTQAITTRQSELRLYHNLIVQQIKDLQGHLKVGVVPNMARIDEITGTLNAACTTFLATIDDLMSLIQPTNAPLSGSKVAQSADDPLSGFPSPQSFVRGSVVGPPSAGHSPVSWNFVDLRPNMSAQLDQSNSQLPGDFLSALDFAKACRSLFRIFDRISDFSATDAMIGRTFAALQQVQADLLGNLERLEMAIQVYTSQRSARDQNGHDQPPCEPPDSSTISIGTLLRNDLKNDRTADAASFYKAILWLSRSLNFVREFLHLLFTLPPPSPDDVADRRGAVQDDSLSVAATEAYSRCLRSFHQWSLRGVAMIVIKSLPTRSQFLRLLLQDDLNSDSPSQALASGNSTIPVDFTTQPELYVQLEKDARHYSDALGRTLTLIEGLFAYLDLERIFTGSETY